MYQFIIKKNNLGQKLLTFIFNSNKKTNYFVNEITQYTITLYNRKKKCIILNYEVPVSINSKLSKKNNSSQGNKQDTYFPVLSPNVDMCMP